ncbi:2Fe-2S iron-sulfur cluster binding domain-containing protein [Vibrio sp. T187]|uniref:FAD-binding oxidoreductase n=1 Tax=Vibrio TaxID=662 RepID=UPI0010C94F41|nr:MULTISPECIES: FAD-binding oxidoreductase [Vibrio]MBW3697575.1 2Fe-2S iron-sulfur cluster binding domain-containing protein [Vibrio sp. T187]
MQYNVKVLPAGVAFKSKGNLLDDALQQSIVLEHSCKTGDCGVCAVELVRGEVENENGEIISEGDFLTCQSQAKTDVIINALYYPELSDIVQQTLPCKVASVYFPAPDIIVLKLRFPPSANFDYLPGQYIDLNYKGVKRSYSIANAKLKTKEIELHIRRVQNGKMSKHLFDENLDVNQLMRIEGPKGTFFVRSGDKPIIMLATGTGIAPIKAAVEQLTQSKDSRTIYIYWGMRYFSDIYDTGLDKLAASLDNIYFIPVLSREPSDSVNRVGYVQDAVLQDFSSFEMFDVYACGSPQMIEQAKRAFEQKELPTGQFFSDAFTPAK